MTDDFDFDFDVERGGTAAADEPAEKAPESSRESRRSGKAANGSGRRNGGADDRPPLVYEDEDGAANVADADAAPKRSSNGRSGSPKGKRDGGRSGNGIRSLRRPRRSKRAEEAKPPSDNGAEDDWLSMADERPGDVGLDSIAAPDDGPAGPPTPGEGRHLARDARRRASSHAGGVGRDGDFEAVLESQPQKSEVAKRGAAVLYGLRGLLDDGRERLKRGSATLRSGGEALSALKERVPGTIARPAPGDGNGKPPRGPSLPSRIGSRRSGKPEPGRYKRIRIGIVLVGIAALAMVSTVFGMMMSIAGDIPQFEDEAQYKASQNSEVFDAEGRKLGTLLSNTQRRLVDSEDISPYVKQAVVAIEDTRFYEHRGVDFQGIARAVAADVMPGGSTQGASTITQQFVKNALEAQGTRTYFQKLREAAYAYHLERQWDKDKILTEYLNTIYFGEGAYGVEAAARTYFGKEHPDCLVEGADPCASELEPREAALLAGIISSPAAYSPRANPQDSAARRNLVLQKMAEQGDISEEEYESEASLSIPAPSDIEKPGSDSLSPYFTEWLRQQVVDRYGAGKAFSGGLDVHTTVDLDMQETAEQIAYDRLAGIEPTAAVVVLDNETGAVKAMVGGNDYDQEPFNLATNGQRQPGSAFKPFVLAAYLANGGSAYDTYTSGPQDYIVPNSGGKEQFHVENYEDNYLGSADVAAATKYSDNSVFVQMGLGAQGQPNPPLGGIRKGPKKVADLAEDMGIRTEVDEVPAIMLGAPSIGFTPLEMTYAFNTIAHNGERVGSNLDSCLGNQSLDDLCPTGITKIVGPDGDVEEKFEEKTQRVLPEGVADTTKTLLHGPVSSGGTGEDAQTPGDEWGKTGTTENHGDAWFCGGTEHLTACVWVGHAMNNTPMETEFGGEPVAGGTFPAQIWGSIMTALEGIYSEREAERESGDDGDSDVSSGSSYTPSYGGSSSGSSGSGGGDGGGGAGNAAPAPSGGGGGSSGGTTGGTGL